MRLLDETRDREGGIEGQAPNSQYFAPTSEFGVRPLIPSLSVPHFINVTKLALGIC
jgi:hypothetical protein